MIILNLTTWLCEKNNQKHSGNKAKRKKTHVPFGTGVHGKKPPRAVMYGLRVEFQINAPKLMLDFCDIKTITMSIKKGNILKRKNMLCKKRTFSKIPYSKKSQGRIVLLREK